LLMLALADFTNKDGIAWPSIARLATMIHVTPRSVKRLIQYAEESGELKVKRNAGRGHTNEYRITLKGDTDDTYWEQEKVTPVAEKVTPASSNGQEKVTPRSPRTIKDKREPLEPLVLLAEHFTNQTGFFMPHQSTMEYTDKWEKPLMAIYGYCADDLQKSNQLMDDAIAKNRDLGLTLISPNSIYKIALNLRDNERRGVLEVSDV